MSLSSTDLNLASTGVDSESAENKRAALDKELSPLLNQIPLLANRLDIYELPGGITNRNIAVTTSARKYVVRISGKNSSLLNIERRAEFENSKIAAAMSIGAPVYEFRSDLGILIIGFINGRTYSADDISTNLDRVARSVKQLHSSPAFNRDFDMFEVQKSYLKVVQDRDLVIPDGYFDYSEKFEEVRRALNSRPQPKVSCNNDLLPANFIDSGSQLWLIDYEYAGNNDACFELGNIWSEAMLEYPQLVELVTHYFGGERPEMVHRAWLQAAVARYGWTLWGSIQNSISSIDFDFLGWGLERFNKAKEAFDSPLFEEALQNL